MNAYARLTENDKEWVDAIAAKVATDVVAPLKARIAYLEQQAARLANLPGLPSEWQPPFQWGTIPTANHVGMECLHDSANRCMVFDCGMQTGAFLARLLNACYPPAPGQES